MTCRLPAAEHRRRTDVWRKGVPVGASWASMAEELADISAGAFRNWALANFPPEEHAARRVHAMEQRHLETERDKRALRPGRTTRRCLRCENHFASTGPGNRLCDPCRALSHTSSPYEPNPGGHTGRRALPAPRSA